LKKKKKKKKKKIEREEGERMWGGSSVRHYNFGRGARTVLI
jgi:hypothetical protein